MKKGLKTAIALGVVLFACLFTQANAQFSVTYGLSNGQNKVAVSSTIKNMKPMSRGIRIVEVSNNTNMNPIIQSFKDSVFSTGPSSFYDVLPVSLTYPTYFYVSVKVITTDTSGKKDTALAVKYLPVLVTPGFTYPKMTLNKLQVSMTTATISGDFESGFDTCYIYIVISYGDTDLLNPVLNYPILDTIWAKVGKNQKWSLSFPINLGVSGYYFSYLVHISNSSGDWNFLGWGKTLDQPAGAVVSTPYNQQGYGSDSVTFQTKTTATGLATKHWSYIATSQTSNPFDSVITMIPTGASDDIIIHTVFKNQITANSDYWVWSCVKNSMNVTPFCSNRVLVQTGATQITTFKIHIDSIRAFDANTEAIYWTAEVPQSSGSGKLVTLGRTYPSGTVTTLADQTLGWGTTRMVSYYPNCSAGVKYQITIYGYDDAFTKLYDAWTIQDTFTFQPKNTTSIKKIVQIEKLSVYPNPATDLIHLSSSDQYSIYNAIGQTLLTGTNSETIDVNQLEPGTYFIQVGTQRLKFLKD